MLFIDILISIPFPRQKRVLSANYLAIEERRQCRKFFRQAFDLQVAADVGVLHVDVLHTSQIMTNAKIAM